MAAKKAGVFSKANFYHPAGAIAGQSRILVLLGSLMLTLMERGRG